MEEIKSGKSCHKLSLSQGSTELAGLRKGKQRTQTVIEMKHKLIALCLKWSSLEAEPAAGILLKVVY